MKPIGKITKEEAKHLDRLYKRANENDDWNPVDRYFRRLASKYKFRPEKISINRRGEIRELEKCCKCHGVATTANGTIYVRDKNEYGKWTNMAICSSCYSKYYPDKAYKELK